MADEKMKRAWEVYKNGGDEIPPPTAPQQSSKVALEVLFRPLREKMAKKLRRLQGKEEASDGR